LGRLRRIGKRMRREEVRSVGHVHSLELLERLGEPQLRTVHEEGVAWLCTDLGAELGTARVGPIEDADGLSEDDCPENSPQKPIKRRKCRVRWDCTGAGEGVVTRGPRKGARMICKVSSLTTEKWAIVSKTHGYIVDVEHASYENKKTAEFPRS
jgi:hypothetical protein